MDRVLIQSSVSVSSKTFVISVWKDELQKMKGIFVFGEKHGGSKTSLKQFLQGIEILIQRDCDMKTPRSWL